MGCSRGRRRAGRRRRGQVDEGVILAGHFAATTTRFAAASGTLLVLHDTTEFSFTRDTPEGVGQLSFVKGRHVTHTVCGLLRHSGLVVTTDGVPLGLAAVKFWTRKKFKGTNALKRRVNPTRVPIEQKESVRWLDNLKQATTRLGNPARCVHVGDRERDIFELFCAAGEAGIHFLVRTCVDRLAGRGKTTVAKKMAREPIRGSHEVEVRDDHGRVSTVRVDLRFCRMTVHPPVGKRKRYARKLGVRKICRSTMIKNLRDHGLDPGPRRGEGTWDEFLKRYVATLWACDFFSKDDSACHPVDKDSSGGLYRRGQLGQCRLLDLVNALAAEAKAIPDLFQRHGILVTQAEMQTQDEGGTQREPVQ